MSTGSNYVTYRFAAKGDRGPLTVFWYDNDVFLRVRDEHIVSLEHLV